MSWIIYLQFGEAAVERGIVVGAEPSWESKTSWLIA